MKQLRSSRLLAIALPLAATLVLVAAAQADGA
jgi:hypothetical protein